MGLTEENFDINNFYNQVKPGTVLVISGWRGVGKTSFCLHAIEKIKQRGFSCAGILSLARFEDSIKTGIFALNINSGESRLIASTNPGEISGFQLGPYTFDEAVLAWADDCIQQWVECGLFVVDELGYLEFDSQNGLFSSFKKLREKRFHLALVVIRPERIDAFQRMGFAFQQITIGNH